VATRWVYIAGRGHSGSTVVDAMLGNEEGIESVGELVAGMGRYDERCSCGRRFAECPYWMAIRRRFEASTGIAWDRAAGVSMDQARIARFGRTLFAGLNDEWVCELKWISSELAIAIANDGLVVDSSKEISRALFLARFVPGSKVIHLVRHPDRVLASNYARLVNGSGFKFMRRRYAGDRFHGVFLLLSCCGWVVGNSLASLVSSVVRGSVLKLRYEDLVRDPAQQISRLEDFLGVPLEVVRSRIERSEEFEVGHNIGGNNMRMAGVFRFDSGKSSNRPLPLRYRILSRIVCWPIMVLYGYR
jgi:hypothetical protein